MALENYRITEFQEKTQVDNGDYVLIDSATDGTHKYQLSRIPAQASAEVDAAVAAEKAQRQAADAELAGDIGTLSSGKVDKVAGKGLSKNDFTDALKTKLDGIEAGAEVNDVTSVAGKTGAVTIDGGDVAYSDETTYADGTVGAAVAHVKSDLNNVEAGDGTRLELVSTIVGAYMNDNGTVVTGQPERYVVKQYKLPSGSIRLYGIGVSIANGLAVCTRRDSAGQNPTVIKAGTGVPVNYNEIYDSTGDGYLYIAINTLNGELVPYVENAFDTYSTIKLKALISQAETDANDYTTEAVNDEIKKIIVVSPNLFDKTAVVNGYVNTSTGAISTGDGTWRTSDFIPVDASKKYYSATGGTYGFYDVNKSFLGYAINSLIEPVANTAYIRKSIKATNLDVCMIVEGNSAPQIYYPFGYIGLTNNVLKKDVSDMTVQTFGDSMVGMGLWQASCMYRLGFKAYINSGNSGYKMSDTGDTASTPIDTVIRNNLNSNADVVTIWGGTNDFYGNAVIGTPSDAVNTTFYGALNLATKHICENYPNNRIVFITPLNRFDDLSSRFSKNADDEYINTQGKTLEDYVNAMIDVCRRNSIKCLDFYHDGGINKWNESALMSDGIHPTRAYFEVLGKRIAENILMLI